MSLNKELSHRVPEIELDLYFAFDMEFVQVQILNCILTPVSSNTGEVGKEVVEKDKREIGVTVEGVPL